MTQRDRETGRRTLKTAHIADFVLRPAIGSAA
jgi:hypothetical protein